jgi:RhoGEF domain
MANYQNTQSYYGQYGAPQHPPQQQQYGQPGRGQPLARTSSFNDGDDNQYFGDANGSPGHGVASGGAYANNGHARTTSVAGRQSEELFIGAGGQQPHGTPYTHGAQQQQYAPQPTPARQQSTYNPAAFHRTSSQYGYQPPYGSAGTPPIAQQTYNTTPPTPHQTYNPAAYQSTVQRHQSYAPPPQSHQHGYNAQQQPYYNPASGAPVAQYATYSQPPQHVGSPQYGHQSVNSPGQQSVYSQGDPPSGGLSSPDFPDSSHQPQHSYNGYTEPQTSPPIYPNQEDPTTFAHRMSQDRYTSVSPQPTSSTPLPTPPSSQSHPPESALRRHPTLRTLPPPPPPDDNDEYRNKTEEELAQENIYREIEAAVMSSDPRHSGTVGNHGLGLQNGEGTNGHVTSTGTGGYVNYDAYDEDSDAEAAAGLAAMQMADEDDRRQSVSSSLFSSSAGRRLEPREPPIADVSGSDSDYANVDMGLYGGGYEGQMSYGESANMSAQGHSSEMDDESRPLPTPGSLNNSRRSGSTPSMQAGLYDYSIPDQDAIHPFPSFSTNARVDTFGTGGLSEPSPHRRKLSFDEGDEIPHFPGDGRSANGSPVRTNSEGIPDLFYHPATSPQRPLPTVPGLASNSIPELQPAGTYRGAAQVQQPYLTGYPVGPNGYVDQSHLALSPQVPRSTSLNSHSSAPQTVAPMRSKTDAEERKRLLKQHGMLRGDGTYDAGTPQTGVTIDDLPMISAKRRFNPAKLSTADFKKCREPWALSAIAFWVQQLSEGENDLREKTIVDGIVALFTHKVPTMNTADAEVLAERIVKGFFAAGRVVSEEEWVKFGVGEVSGVVWQLTGSGCYASRVHEQEIGGRCYSHHCSRTLKKINLNAQTLAPQKKAEDWATYWKLTLEDIKTRPRDTEVQNNLHEVIQKEDNYVDQLEVLKVLYRDALRNAQPPIISHSKIEKFIKEVFGKVEAVQHVNKEHLLAQMKYRQQEQGPWLVGFSDIFREWIRRARIPYIEYASGFPEANALVRKEIDRNLAFRNLLENAQKDERSRKLGWDTFLKSPITQIQRYVLLLETAHKNMKKAATETSKFTEEIKNIEIAIEEVRKVTLECDARVDEVSKKVELGDMGSRLVLRPGMDRVELNLNHLGRELIFQGDLQRMGSNRFNWLDTHAILFDHYLVLAKLLKEPSGSSKHDRYDVSKLVSFTAVTTSD